MFSFSLTVLVISVRTAHPDFEIPEFFMPKLLIKGQWYNVHPYTGQVTFYKVPETHGLVTLYVNIFYNLLIDNRI